MTATIASMPDVKVEIAFSPTNIFQAPSLQTWTDVSAYNIAGSSRGGRQHYLDRIEATAVTLVMDNRTGYFFSSGHQLRARLPMRITATWAGTPYTVFYGIIESAEPRWYDELNTEITLYATDLLKYLSLRNLLSNTLYQNVADIAATQAWYHAPEGNAIHDPVNGYTATINGHYANVEGVCLYSTAMAMDLTNGTGDSQGSIILPHTGYETGLDFWVLGQGIAGETLIALTATTGLANVDCSIVVDTNGQVITPAGLRAPVAINDGLWHHVAIYIDQTTQYLHLCVDGVVVNGPQLVGGSLVSPNTKWILGAGVPCYLDNIVMSAGNLETSDVLNRWGTGALLRRDTLAADRVAEVLYICGYGSMASGVISMPNLYVDGTASGNVYTDNSSKNGTTYIQYEPSSVTTRTALDLILKTVETEIGAFFQNDDGTFSLQTRAYPYVNAHGSTLQATFGNTSAATYRYEAPSLAILYDDVDTWTRVVVTPVGGTAAIYVSPNQDLYGYSTLSKDGTMHTTERAAQDAAEFLGYIYQSPLPRVADMELRSTYDNGSNLPAALGLNYNDRVKLIKQSAGVATDLTIVALVESVNHEWTVDNWHSKFVLDPYAIRNSTQANTPFLLFNDATAGRMDGTNILL